MKKHNDIVIYESRDGTLSVNVNIFEESVWLNLRQMSELFQRNRTVISRHINNIFRENELDEKVVCANFAHTTEHGAIKGQEQNVMVKYYNLDVIISVGYRVKSQRGIQFRQWATKILKQYLINGYTVNENKIKQIQSSIEELVSSQKILRKDVDRIESLLEKLLEKPIIINNQISVASEELERKLVLLLDVMIDGTKNQHLVSMISKMKKDVVAKDKRSKNRMFKFLMNLGDDKSDIYKIIKGAGVAKSVIDEVIKVGEKLRDLF